ncbi:hypothetical protein MHB44_17875 [Lysinibacillus sp. FSL H8-0500]|uniref:hypothetical protein n=1 Tax=Lysinibacillus sp. FSL H8-0500 TaxID=2921393 RepID=UPI003100C382
MFILSIKSKRWNIAMQHFYFVEKPANIRKSMRVVGYTHSLVPSRKLVQSETIHISLRESELSLYLALSEGNRQLLRCAQQEFYQVILYREPSTENLRAFQQFYNQFAKRKRLKGIGKSQMETLLLLNQQGALLLSEVQSICGQTMCYRLDIVHAKKAMSYYEVTCDAAAMAAHLQRPLRYANRFLLWHNLLHLKQQGFVLYDMGELTDDPHVRALKQSFGGEVVNVYSGYITLSKIRARLLGVKKWRK